jgi:hypothetical protein
MKNRYDYFSKYRDIKKLIKDTKDPDIIDQLRKTLDFMRTKMFKSDEYLDSIIEKDFEDITPQDLIDLVCRMGDPENDNTWYAAYLISDHKIGMYITGLYHFSEPCLDLSENGFGYRARIDKNTEEHVTRDDAPMHSYDFKHLGLISKYERDCVIKTTINMYRVFKLNDKLHKDIRSYPSTWKSKHDKEDFWDGLFRWLVKCDKFEAIDQTNFDWNQISEEPQNLLKSKLSSSKYNLGCIKKAS